MIGKGARLWYNEVMLNVDVKVKYEEETRLRFSFEKGITLVLGEFGSYKSTLLKVIGGVKVIEDGYITLDGQNIEQLPPKDRNMMLIGGETMPVYKKVGMALMQPLRLRGVKKGEARKRAIEAAERFGLDFVDPVSEHKRAFFEARMSLRTTEVTMFDEPYHFFGEDVSEMIRGRKSDYVIVASSDGEDARKLCPDRLIVIRGGEVLQSGSYREVKEAPVNRYVDLLVNM